MKGRYQNPFLRKVRTEVRVGDIVRNVGDGSKIMQVLSLDGRDVQLISAGTVKGGEHKPSVKPQIIRGLLTVKPGEVINLSGSNVYVKVVSREPLEGLHA